ncbi:hypothetical protein [Bacillus wiedmannii]|uniref:hypothetical protein n=2 Tax=Bacillus cereus group TaxID=86661 RepID=UPI002E2294C5|nr:hypothetical protein [Bacillus wiedmannii]
MRAEHERSQSIYRYPDGGVIRLEYKKRGKGIGYAKHPRYRLYFKGKRKMIGSSSLLTIQDAIRIGKTKKYEIKNSIESEVRKMEDNVKLLDDNGMLGMEFNQRTIRVYNTEGNVMELLSTKEQVQEAIDYLKECQKEMK